MQNRDVEIKEFTKKPLKSKLIFAIVSIILLFGISATFAVFYYSKGVLVEQEKDSLKQTTLETSRSLEKKFASSATLVETLSSNSKVLDAFLGPDFDAENTSAYLEQFNMGDAYSSIYLMNPQGLTIASTDRSFIGKNYSFRGYFSQALKESKGTDVVLGVTSKQLGYYFSHAVKNKTGEILGVVIAKLKPDEINKELSLLANETTSNIMLTDEFGVIVASNVINRLYKSLGTLNSSQLQEIDERKRFSEVHIDPMEYNLLQEQLLSTNNKIALYDYKDEENSLFESLTLTRVGNFPFYLSFEQSQELNRQHTLTLAGIISAFVIVSALSAAFILTYITGKILKPLDELTKATQKIARGELNASVNIHSKDEFQELGQYFNEMAEVIKKDKEELEIRISERTKELEEQKEAIVELLNETEEEKKRSQTLATDLQKFKLAVEQASDHIVITDKNGDVLFANDSVKRITGFSPNEILGKKAGCSELWGGLMPTEFYKKLWHTIKMDKKSFSGEVTNKRKDGTQYTAKATISPVLDEDQNVNFFVGIERDITHEKEVDRMKTEFISLASHQLKTPLSAMKWFLEMLLNGDMGEFNEEQREYLQNIDHSNERMIELVNALLNVSRIESGRIIVDPQPTDLSELVNCVINEIDPKIKKKNINLVVSMAENIPEVVLDKKLVSNVYQNLLTNAVNFTSEGGEITVLISKKEDEVISQISDNGIGIAKKDHGEIFEKFYRTDNAIETFPDGNGLGLYLVKAIVETSGGTIWFKSKKDEGTTFWFSLPLKGVEPREGVVSIAS